MFEAAEKITIIMRTRNCGWIIDQTLKALFSQRNVNFDLLIMESGSKDNTLEKISKYPCRIIQGKAENYFPGQILNKAMEETCTEIVVFLNSDTVLLTPYCLFNLLEAYKDSCAAAFGRQVARKEAWTWVRRDYEVSFPDSLKAPPWMHFSIPIATMKKKVWEEHHFFTETWGSEDMEWGWWAKCHDKKICYVSQCIAMHSHNYSLKQLYGRRFIEGEADAFIYESNYGFLAMMYDICKSCLRDLLDHIRKGSFLQIFKLPLVRITNYWSYYQGFKLGKNRKLKGDKNTQVGQSTVLSRYDEWSE